MHRFQAKYQIENRPEIDNSVARLLPICIFLELHVCKLIEDNIRYGSKV